MTDEQDRALCEANCNSESDAFFAARPEIDNDLARRIFYAGHRRAWISYLPLVAKIAQPEQTEQGKRQPLTDEQIIDFSEAIWGSELDYKHTNEIEFAREIEAAHGITPLQGKI